MMISVVTQRALRSVQAVVLASSHFVVHRRPLRSRLSHTRPKCAIPSQTTFPCSISLLMATTHIPHSPSKVHHALRNPPCHCRIRLQQLCVTPAATTPVVLARGEDVQVAATAIALAGYGQSASPAIGAVAEVLAGSGFEREAGASQVHGAVVEYGRVGG
jgi:hypothetical protein